MNCKPGIMAIVIKAELQENIGIIVDVVSECPVGGPGYWWCSTREPRRTVSGLGYILSVRDASMPDSWLRPVSGLPLNEEIGDEVTA